MEQRILQDVLVLSKRMGNLLNEVLDVSRQMADALTRGDQVVIRMYLAMRAEPIQKLRITDRALRTQRKDAPPEDARRLDELFDGAPGETPGEKLLAEQIAANRRLHQQVMELDQNLNRRITRDKSIYQ